MVCCMSISTQCVFVGSVDTELFIYNLYVLLTQYSTNFGRSLSMNIESSMPTIAITIPEILFGHIEDYCMVTPHFTQQLITK